MSASCVVLGICATLRPTCRPALRKPPFLIRDVRYFSPRPHSTRWSDNDVSVARRMLSADGFSYGHLNKFAMLLEALLTAAARGTGKQMSDGLR